jgi:hypothetical protein
VLHRPKTKEGQVEGYNPFSNSMTPNQFLPSAFPDALFEVIKDRIVPKLTNPSPAMGNLLGGHNGVRYRLRACVDYSDEFVECLRLTGDAPPIEGRYQQEKVLFGFFVSGLAALDCFAFFLYFGAAHLRPTEFPTQTAANIKGISLKSTVKAFSKEFPSDVMSTELNALLNDPNFTEWVLCRNVLAHRAVPGRVVYASVGTRTQPPAADWQIDPGVNLKIDAALTPPRLTWLIATLAKLIVAADQFTQKYF